MTEAGGPNSRAFDGGDDNIGPAETRRRDWLPVASLLLLSIGVFAPTLSHGFVWDDHEQVVDNEHLRRWSSLPEFWRRDILELSRAGGEHRSNYYRPLFYVQYWVYFRLFGLWSPGWHALAILHQFLAAAAAMHFARRLGLSRETAWAGAALFVVHPAHGESAAWVAAAFNDPPAAALLLCGLSAHLRWTRDGDARGRLRALLAYAAALCLKESALSMLLLVPLVDWYARGGAGGLRHVLRYVPHALALALAVVSDSSALQARAAAAAPHGGTALSAISAAAGVGVLILLARLRGRPESSAGTMRAFTPYAAVTLAYLLVRKATLGTMLGVYVGTEPLTALLPTFPSLALSYLRLLVWPLGLAPSYPLRYAAGWGDVQAWGSLLIVAAVVVGAGWLTRGRRELRFAALWVAACVWPVFNIRSFRPMYLVHQRYLFLASLGVCLALAWGLTRGIRTTTVRRAALALLLLIGAGSNAYYNRAWRSDDALWRRICEVDPHNPAGFGWLGGRAMEAGELEEAEAWFARARQAEPDWPPGYQNQAVLLHTRRGRPDLALPWYRQALAAYRRQKLPDPFLVASCRVNYAVCVAEVGRRVEAVEELLAAAAEPPHPVDAFTNAAVLLREDGRLDRTESVLRGALERHPTEAGPRRMLIDVLRETGRIEAAAEEARRLVELQPGSADAVDLLDRLERQLRIDKR